METNTNKQNMGWGILLICFGVATMTEMYTGLSDWLNIGVFFLGGLITLALFLSDRSDWLLLLASYIMLAVAVLGAVAFWGVLDGDLIGSFALLLIGAPFLAVYLRNKENWWAIIPAYILLAISLMLLLTSINFFNDKLIAPFVLFSIAIPFLVVYFKNQEHWWALIPAYVMVVVGIMVGLIEYNIFPDLLIPSYINFAIALPFFVVYFRNKKNWWALIPGGILGLISLGFLLSIPAGRFLAPVVMIAVGIWLVLRQTKK